MSSLNVGIFLNYGPKTDLTREGLGRYTGTLINGIVENENVVTIACPKGLKKNVEKLIEEFHIDKKKVLYVTTSHIPPIWTVYEFLTRERKEKKAKKSIKAFVENRIYEMAQSVSWLQFFLQVMLIAFLGVAYILFVGVSWPIVKLRSIVRHIFKDFAKKQLRELPDDFIRKLYRLMMRRTGDELVNRINHQQPLDIWYVPALFWPCVNDIKNSPVLINAPDLVTEQFSGQFASLTDEIQTIDCRETINGGRYFVTYCKYTGKMLFENQYVSRDKQWTYIYHANHNLRDDVYISDDIQKKLNAPRNLTDEFCKALLAPISTNSPLVDGASLANTRYIFYASQFRPNKNIMLLLKAYNNLIRKRFRHERLVFTGNIDNAPEAKQYIEDNNMLGDVVFCTGVNAQQLAALYQRAVLVVNPTLYEGGFPFTFGEGMSVGTPSIMSDIPQVREIISDEGVVKYSLFNPYDINDLEKKMIWALDNADKLYELQAPIYKRLSLRTDKVVAEEYINAFKKIIKTETNKSM